MFENLQQEMNYLPDLKTGQLGLPFVEDLVVSHGLSFGTPGSIPDPDASPISILNFSGSRAEPALDRWEYWKSLSSDEKYEDWLSRQH